MSGADLAVVVGATGTIGEAVVRRLAARGQRILAVARDAGRLDELAASVPGVTSCVADVGQNSSTALIAAAVDEPVRMAVFAAGLPVRGSVDTIDPALLAVGADIKLCLLYTSDAADE